MLNMFWYPKVRESILIQDNSLQRAQFDAKYKRRLFGDKSRIIRHSKQTEIGGWLTENRETDHILIVYEEQPGAEKRYYIYGVNKHGAFLEGEEIDRTTRLHRLLSESVDKQSNPTRTE